MAKKLRETFSDVVALMPRYSWEIMDEEQRDDLMAKVVLPRYMKTTADGVQLGPKTWATMLGASAGAVRKRIERLQNKGTTERTRTLEQSRKRHARSYLRQASPEQIADVFDSDPKIQRNVAKAFHHSVAPRVEPREPRSPSFIDLVAKTNSALIELEALVRSWRSPRSIPEEFSASSFDDIAAKAMRIKDTVNALRGASNDEFQDIVRDFRVVTDGEH